MLIQNEKKIFFFEKNFLKKVKTNPCFRSYIYLKILQIKINLITYKLDPKYYQTI